MESAAGRIAGAASNSRVAKILGLGIFN